MYYDYSSLGPLHSCLRFSQPKVLSFLPHILSSLPHCESPTFFNYSPLSLGMFWNSGHVLAEILGTVYIYIFT